MLFISDFIIIFTTGVIRDNGPLGFEQLLPRLIPAGAHENSRHMLDDDDDTRGVSILERIIMARAIDMLGRRIPRRMDVSHARRSKIFRAVKGYFGDHQPHRPGQASRSSLDMRACPLQVILVKFYFHFIDNITISFKFLIHFISNL